MLTFFMFLPAMFSSYKGMAQRSSSRFSIVVSPALFIPVSVAAQAGIQYKVTSRVSILAEGAWPMFYPANTEYEKIDYWRTGIEIKHFVKRDSTFSKYFSVQCNYLTREFEDRGEGFYYTKTQTFVYNNAAIQSSVLSPALKFGLEISSRKRFYADVFVGAGVRFVFTEYSAKNVLVTSTTPPEQSIFKFDDAWKYNYTLMRPHATAGVRFGVRL